MSCVQRMCLILALLAAPALAEPKLLRDAPHIWNVTPDRAIIAWFSNEAGRSAILEYGPTLEYGTRIPSTPRPWPLLQSGGPMYQHAVIIENLQPDTRYYYRIVSGERILAPPRASEADDYYFRTAKSPSDHSRFTFLVLGDGGEGNKYQRAITWQMEQVAFDFVLHTGDVVYDNGSDAEWHLNYYPIYRNLIRNRPWFLSLGNHEYLRSGAYYIVAPEHAVDGQRLLTSRHADAAQITDPAPLVFLPQAAGSAAGYFENAILPDQPGDERYYSFDWGAAHIVVLDSNRSFTPGAPGDPQYQWLIDDLSRSTAPWKIVCFHHPMTSIGKPAYVFSEASATRLRKDWHPIFEKYGVDVVFTGHDHTYQRSLPIIINPETGDISRDDQRGIVHIITGGGGGGLSGQSVFPHPDWHSGVFHKRHHFLLVTVDGESMQITAVADADINTPGVTEKAGTGGPSEILDTVTLKRRRPRQIEQEAHNGS